MVHLGTSKTSSVATCVLRAFILIVFPALKTLYQSFKNIGCATTASSVRSAIVVNNGRIYSFVTYVRKSTTFGASNRSLSRSQSAAGNALTASNAELVGKTIFSATKTLQIK